MNQFDESLDAEEETRRVYKLNQYNAELRRVGLELAEAALFVVREYDGTHRLAKAASKFIETVANEGGRGNND